MGYEIEKALTERIDALEDLLLNWYMHEASIAGGKLAWTELMAESKKILGDKIPEDCR